MKLELCASSVEAIQLAREFDFDRIELCQSLEQGGLTPSPGMIEYAVAHGVEVHVLVRHRAGGFNYTMDEIEIMLRDIVGCKELGAKGVVIGALNEMGRVDEKIVELMVKKAAGMHITFHRAFDDTIDFQKSIDVLINLGVNRILSSGLARSVDLGLPILKSMKEYANERIEIMPGGGINSNNIKRVINEVNPDGIHFSATNKQILDGASNFSETILKVDKSKIKRLIDSVK
jgi:copper homeostasis protein